MSHGEKVHYLHVQPRWFKLLQSSTKRFEGRLNDASVSSIRTNDVLIFQTTSSDESVELACRVVSVTQYADFEHMMAGDRLTQLLPGVTTKQEGLDIYRSFPGYRDGENQFGAIVFEVSVIHSSQP